MMTKLHLPAALFLALGALGMLAGLGRSQFESPDAPRRDLHGDPLPPAALVRLGTVRLQHDGEIVSGYFSADGKTLTSIGLDHALRCWDLATGKELACITLALPQDDVQRHRQHLPSPDGKTLATIHMNTDSHSIQLWDLATGKPRLRVGPLARLWFRGLAFSPDGTVLAASGSDGEVRLVDVASGAVRRKIKANNYGSTPVFSPDGRLLAGNTTRGIVVADVATGKEIRLLPQQNAAHWAFSPDAKRLAVADGPLQVWDLDTGKVILRVSLDERVELGNGSSTVRRPRDLAFAPDGKLLAVNVSGAVVLLDPATGNKVRTLLGDRRANKPMFFSPDGRHLAVPGQMNFYVFETATGKLLHHDVGHQGGVKSLAFAPDGKTLATADIGAVRLWDAATGTELRRWPRYLSRDGSSLAFAPDGKSLAHAGGATLGHWDLATGIELPRFKSLQALAVAFSPDGALLAATTPSGPALWDVATGRNVRQFDKDNQRGDMLIYAPDARTVASIGNALYLWDTATGKLRHKIVPPPTADRAVSFGIYNAAVFSPDGAYVAAFGGRNHPTDDTRRLNLYDVGTGKQVGRFLTTDCHKCHMTLAYSPDGRTVGMGDSTRDVTLWEVITGKQRAKLAGHRRYMESLAFAPDGKRLASGSADGTALVWDLRAAARSAPVAPVDCWRILAGEDAVAAYDAIHALVRMPEQALPLLRQHLKPVDAVEPRRLEALLADLDSDSFNTRQQATAELEILGDLAEAALRKALAGNPSLEVRHRLDKLLDRLTTIQVELPALLQALRGLEVLEHIGSAEAREQLKALAAGAPGARQTREAKAALQRLARNP